MKSSCDILEQPAQYAALLYHNDSWDLPPQKEKQLLLMDAVETMIYTPISHTIKNIDCWSE